MDILILKWTCGNSIKMLHVNGKKTRESGVEKKVRRDRPVTVGSKSLQSGKGWVVGTASDVREISTTVGVTPVCTKVFSGPSL